MLTIDRFLEKVDFFPTEHPDCWIWVAGRYSKGYGQFWYKGKVQPAQRVSYELFIGPIPKGLHVLHRCDISPCVNPNHLWVGTNADNHEDALSKGRLFSVKGELHSNAKITENDVRDIRERYKTEKVSYQILANEYGLSASGVQHIIERRTWKHI